MSTDPEEVRATVKKMLELCPPLLEQSNKIDDTAIHIAARYGRIAIVESIMEVAKMDRDGEGSAWPRILSTTNEEGNTALHEAVRFNYIRLVKLLISEDDHHQTFYSANVPGETPLYLAAERGYYELVCEIVNSFTDPAYRGPNGRTALHAAVIRNDEGMTQKLLEHKEGVLAKEVDERGCTPLHLAASLGHTMIVKKLLQHNRSAAYVREKDQKRTALHFAASKGHVNVMREIISQCPDCCELVDEKCRNVLHCSILAEREDGVVNFVLEDPWLSNILLNGKDDNGDTPLHQIADTSSFRVTTFETDARVDKMAFNKANQNAFDILLQSEGDFYYSSTQGGLKDNLKGNGVIPGCRILRNKKKVENTERKNLLSADEYNEVKNSHLVVATLIATVSFAAGFTMPGGYHGDKGSDQGSAVLSRNAAFQAFVITNTIAMTLSSCSVLLHLYALGFRKRKVMTEADRVLFSLTMLALIAMVVAFITGTYAVLGHNPSLGITVCVLGCVLFFVSVEFMLYDEWGIVEMYLPLLPLSLAYELYSWMVMKMLHVSRKLYYHFLRLVSPASKGNRSKQPSASQVRPGMDMQMIVGLGKKNHVASIKRCMTG